MRRPTRISVNAVTVGSVRAVIGHLGLKLWQVYLCVGAIVTVLYLWVPPFKGFGAVINLLGLSAVIAVVVGIRRNRPQARGPWWLFALGLFLFWLGDLYTYSYPQLLHADVPFPSFGDVLYLAVYPVLMVGLLRLVRHRNPERDRAGLIDALIMTFGLALISWIVLIAPYVHDGTLSLLPKLVSIAYPLGDILLLAAAIRLAVDGGKREPAFYLVALSIVMLLVTDFAYGVVTLHNAYHHQLILDAGWIAFYLFWGAAALHPSMRELANPARRQELKLTWLRLVLLTCATLIAPGIALARAIREGDGDLVIIISVSGILFALVVVRMAGLVRQRERHIARDRTLARSAADIVAATSREQIYRAALTAVDQLVDSGVIGRLCFAGDDLADIVALGPESGAQTVAWSVPGALFALPTFAPRSDDAPVPALTRTERGDLRLPVDAAYIQTVDLSSRDGERSRGVICLSGPRPVSRTALGGLESLATQVSLALASNTLTQELHRRSSEARFRSLVQHTHDLITILDANGTVTYQSPSIEASLGYTPEAIVGTQFRDLMAAPESGRLMHVLTDGAAQAGPDGEVIECSLRHRDGSIRQIEILYTDLLKDETVHGIVLNGRDISERKAFEEQLEHQAFHDSVTLLPNRALLNERVRHGLARARREASTLAVIFLDLDDFKTINDSLGHAAGDHVLREVAKRLATSIRASDTAARFGGDEFAILLEDITGPQEATQTAERLIANLAPPFNVEGKEFVVHASLGVSVGEHNAVIDAHELIRNADVAMYMAKRDGKGGYRAFEPAMHADVLARLELRADLQRALINDEFELYYQPIVRLNTGQISGVEALIRWRHPQRGLLSPDAFIPFAEESGLIIPIGRWVLREACRQAKTLQDQVTVDPPLAINVNLSVQQLHDSEIVAEVHDALIDAQLPPASLTLEITETVVMSNAELAEQRLSELKQLGVNLAVDDFGTGYSSLGYLARFPVDVIKMDRSFLSAGASPVTSGLAKAVIGLGKTFEIAVVAEGIEFSEQWETLRGLDCEFGQGYHFAEPMNADRTLDYLLAEHPSTDPAAASPDHASLANAPVS